MDLADEDGTVEPAYQVAGGTGLVPEIERLPVIVKTFNTLFGNIEWKDTDKIQQVIAEEMQARLARNKAYLNAQRDSDRQSARRGHDRALGRVVLDLLSDLTELFKLFSGSPGFKRRLSDMVFDSTYRPPGASSSPPAQAQAGL